MTSFLRTPSCLGAVALIAALSTSPVLAAPTVVISGPSGVAPGGSIQLNVTASGFTDLYAYQFDVLFDGALFQSTSVTQGGFLGSAGTTFFDGGLVDNAAGSIAFVLESLIGPGAGASGGGDLAQLNFDAEGSMSSGRFSLSNFIAYDSALNPIDVVLRDLSVSIPEPSALALALAALGAVGFGATRRPRRAAPEAMAGA